MRGSLRRGLLGRALLAEAAVEASGIDLAGGVAAYGAITDVGAGRSCLHFLTRVVDEIPFVVMSLAVNYLDSFRFVRTDHANDGASTELHWRIAAGRETHGTGWLGSWLWLSKAACLTVAAGWLSDTGDLRLAHCSGLTRGPGL